MILIWSLKVRYFSAMERVFILAVMAVLVTGSTTECPEWKARIPSGKKPNILFIAFDDLKPLAGCYGDTLIRTPHIDRLAASGTLFLNAHCQQAVCGPSRASLLTGLYPDATGVWDLETRMRDVHPDILTLPQYFKENGYFTTGVGKIFDGRCCDGYNTQDVSSWSEPFLSHNGRLFADPSHSSSRVPIDQREVMTRPSTESATLSDTVYHDIHIAEVAVEKMQQLASGDQPFFLAVGFKKPHLPFTAPEKYWDLYHRCDFRPAEYRMYASGAPEFAYHNSGELRNGYTDIPLEGLIEVRKQVELIHGYYATVSFVDAQLGKVLDQLAASGLTGNTIIVLWGDHGFHLGDHGIFCKHTNYEQATRSPLIIAAPGMLEDHDCASPAGFVDIFPTLCDLAGLEVPGHLHGTSLRPILEGVTDSVKPVALSQYPRTVSGKPVMGYAYRSERYRYVEWIEKDFRNGDTTGPVIARELYDYMTDPLEKVDLSDRPEYSDLMDWFSSFLPTPLDH